MRHFFIDANIFIYIIVEDEKYVDKCQKLLENTVDGEIRSFTSVLVLNEVTHKLMTLELAEKMNIPPHRVMSEVRDDSKLLKKIDETWKNIIRILKIDNLTVLDTDMNTFLTGSDIAKENNLLITDSMHLATMNAYGIETMATTDKRIKESKIVQVWDPSEIELDKYLSD